MKYGARRWTRSMAFVCVCLLPIGLTSPVFGQAGEPAISAVFETPRRTPYVFETVPLTLTITAAGVRLGQNFSLRGLPEQEVLRLGPFRELAPSIDRGPLVQVRRFTCEARPMQSGRLTVAPVLQAALLERRWGFFGIMEEETPVTIAVKPFDLEVRPLPDEGRPASFSGAVGRFTFDVEARPTDIALGDLITLTMTIRGDGYLENVVAPQLTSESGFKVYPPRITEERPGWKVFEQIVIPLATNVLAVPALEFSYFDPQTDSYQCITRGPFFIRYHARETTKFEPYRPADASVKTEGAVGRMATSSDGRKAPWYRRQQYLLLGYAIAFALGWLAVTIRAKRRVVVGVVSFLVGAFLFLPLRKVSVRLTHKGNGAVVVRQEAARLAPGSMALETFEVPAGAAVYILETFGDWAKIDYEDRRGWVHKDSLKATADVSPP